MYCNNCKQNVKGQKKAILKAFLIYIASFWVLFIISKAMNISSIIGGVIAGAYYYNKKEQCPICKDTNFSKLHKEKIKTSKQE